MNLKNKSTQIKYAENTAYHNTMAQVVNNQIQAESSKKTQNSNSYDNGKDVADKILKKF